MPSQLRRRNKPSPSVALSPSLRLQNSRYQEETIMRELVVKYLNNQISRRSFVGNLTKAGITVTAAQACWLRSAQSVSRRPARRQRLAQQRPLRGRLCGNCRDKPPPPPDR
jgi:hypothetical protein